MNKKKSTFKKPQISSKNLIRENKVKNNQKETKEKDDESIIRE